MSCKRFGQHGERQEVGEVGTSRKRKAEICLEVDRAEVGLFSDFLMLSLIGAADEAVELPSLDEINRSSAELSLDFFISRCLSKKEEEHYKLLGKRALTVEKE